MDGMDESPALHDEIAAALDVATLPSPGFEYELLSTLAHSLVARVHLASASGMPSSVIYKRSQAGAGAFLTLREVRFYHEFGRTLPADIAPHAYLAARTDAGATLVLEDLEPRFRPCASSVPSLDEARAFVRSLARVHACTHQTDGDIWAAAMCAGPYDTLAGRLQMLALGFDAARADTGLDDETADLVHVIASVPVSLAAFASERSILHGDAHFWNAVYAADHAVLFDWGNTCLGPGEIDLAHAVAMNLPRDVRRGWERALLDDYHDALIQEGVSRGRVEIEERYRLGVAYALTVPLRQRAAGVPERIWRPLLANVSAAARDLDIAALLSAR